MTTLNTNIIKEIENKKRDKSAYGSQSSINCPHCSNQIDYYWSQFAGVQWAKCRTENCFDYKKETETKSIPRKKAKLILRKKPKLVRRKQLTLF